MAESRKFYVSDLSDAIDGLRGFSELLNLAADSQGVVAPLPLYQLLNPLLDRFSRICDDLQGVNHAAP